MAHPPITGKEVGYIILWFGMGFFVLFLAFLFFNQGPRLFNAVWSRIAARRNFTWANMKWIADADQGGVLRVSYEDTFGRYNVVYTPNPGVRDDRSNEGGDRSRKDDVVRKVFQTLVDAVQTEV